MKIFLKVALVAIGLLGTGCRKLSDPSKIRASGGDALPDSGVYAKQLIFSTKSTANGLTMTGKTERLQLVTLTRKTDVIEIRALTCGLKSVGSRGTELAFPEAFAKSVPALTYNYKIESTGAKTILTSDRLVELLGAKLRDAENEALPKSSSDPRAFDQDQDGRPGMSVNLKVGVGPFKAAGQVYIAQRSKWTETSVMMSSDGFAGTLETSLEQETLGSDSSILGAVRPVLTAVPNGSEFKLRKIPDDSTCDTVRREAESLFGPLKM